MTDPKSKPDAPPADPEAWKIYPRNLTARATYIVPGNPVSSRPETGVDNCYPGLELDARNIQKYFFPGTYFEVYRNDGARLAGLEPADRAEPWASAGLSLDEDRPLFLWAIKGRTSARQDPADPPITAMLAPARSPAATQLGLYAWRTIRALYSGRVGIAIGPEPPRLGAELSAAEAALGDLWASGGGPRIELRRGKDGKIAWAVLVADRTRYLDDQGVLDPDVYEPGELTRTLCTPWTYDFRDCQCFYWASNKPDVVSSEDGKYPYLDFQRRGRDVEPQTADIAYDYMARKAREIDYAELMVGWEQLRPVLNGREQGERYVPSSAPVGRPMPLDEVKQEMAYLSSVEHGLAIQYLYAYYSIDAPRTIPSASDVRTFRLWSAANEIFNIALDEMRHFRWANEILQLIGGDTTVSRSAILGRSFKVPFYLQSLTSKQLQWFIDVERPSKSTASGLDGMYVGVLESLQRLPADEIPEPNRRRAVEIVKLIIDEGEGHFERFSAAQQNLAFYDDTLGEQLPAYVRRGVWRSSSDAPQIPSNPLYGAPVSEAPGTVGARLQRRSNVLYISLLKLLQIAFSMPAHAGSGIALRGAIGLMLRMNDVNFQLAERGSTPLFHIPPSLVVEPPQDAAEARALLDEVKAQLADEPDRVQAVVGDRMAAAHQICLHELYHRFEQGIRAAFG